MIRKASIKDVDKINELGNKLHNNFTQTYHMETEIDNNLSIVLVNEDNNLVNGYLYAQNFGDNIDLLSIYVDNSNRCQHIGSNLVKYLIDNYCYQGVTITLEVSESNTVALAFYEKLGFKIVNVRKNYYPDGDAYLMKWGI